ncbi:MAG: hypothetical protein HKN26_14625 [Acidimicrobiales bacterium]|nr:hypothetical protein [Acidimicrobiales bacterium]
MSAVHEAFSWVVVAATAIAGTWALAAQWVEPLRHRLLWPAVIVGHVVVAVQVALGMSVVAIDGIEVNQTHLFYGFLTLMSVGLLYGYKDQIGEWRYAMYGGGTLWIMGLAIRAMTLPGAA